MTTLLLLLALGAGLWIWQDCLRVRERARHVCLRFCQDQGVLLLDDTVALDRVWLQRADTGWMQLERRYTFEFTSDGRCRNGGMVVMLGERVKVLALDGGDLLIL